MDSFLDDDWMTGSWKQLDFMQPDDSVSWGNPFAFDSSPPVTRCQLITCDGPTPATALPPTSYTIRPGPSKQRRMESDIQFQCACQNPLLVLNPRELGFLPLLWPDRIRRFSDLVDNFFRKKTSSDSRFLHKLFNAIQLSEFDPNYFQFVGVAWVTDRVLKVDKYRFAALLGIRVIDGSLFHKQGNFPSHGFVEIAPDQARNELPLQALEGVDFDVVRLFVHGSDNFFRGCGPEMMRNCKWFNSRKNEKDSEEQQESFIP
jgi:hypothetical protein